tara:strand:- start:17 stop:298 length:282 start_codon:yes stop_codon:yes gene_type:complete
MTAVTAEDFLKKTGMEEPMAPGMIKYRYITGNKEGGSYTVVYDWRSNPDKIRVEVRPGLTGKMPPKEELKNYAVWLQSRNFLELDLSDVKGHA